MEKIPFTKDDQTAKEFLLGFNKCVPLRDINESVILPLMKDEETKAQHFLYVSYNFN
jgi:hypothetical protein